MTRRFSTILIILGLSASLVACDSEKKKKKPAARKTPVTIMRVTSKVINVPYASVGTIRALKNPIIKAKVMGTVEKLLVSVGNSVVVGQPLVKLSNHRQEIDLKKAQASVDTAKAELTEKTFAEKRYKKAYQGGAIALLKYKSAETAMKVAQQRYNASLEALKAAKHEVARTTVRSPIFGHIQKIMVSKGDFLKPGESIMKLINRNELIAELPFSQERVSKFKIGQTVKITSPASPGKSFVGRITAIEPSIDPRNRSFNVILRFYNLNTWRSGSSAGAQIFLDQPETGFIVPKESLVLKKKGEVIFYIVNGVAKGVSAKVLYHWKDKLAIQAKLPNPADVVVDGAPYLADKAAVNVTKTIKAIQ